MNIMNDNFSLSAIIVYVLMSARGLRLHFSSSTYFVV